MSVVKNTKDELKKQIDRFIITKAAEILGIHPSHISRVYRDKVNISVETAIKYISKLSES